MVTIESADKALKTFYLGVVAEQLNVGVNPLLAKIEQTQNDVWGKEIKKLATYGLNGGVGSGDEAGDLPLTGANNYAQFTLGLKNLFGRIEISDKAIRASQNSAGAFVNLLNAEMEGLLKASKFNLGRMLFGDGSGVLAKTVENVGDGNNCITVDSLINLEEGMSVDLYSPEDSVDVAGARIVSIDREKKVVKLSKAAGEKRGENYKLYVQGSKDRELTGLGAIFNKSASLYGLSRTDYPFLNPYTLTSEGALTTSAMQDAIDFVEQASGGNINMIVGSYNTRKQYIEFIKGIRMNMDYMQLDGGYKALSYNGIPFIVDRFVPENDVYLLNTDDFKLHQLCDWRWLEGDGGSVLRQNATKACYSATLVKYADLLCDRPIGQAKLTFNGTNVPDHYIVSFDSQGGSYINPQIVSPGRAATKPTNPVKLSYSFYEWQYNGHTYDFSTPVTKDMTIEAVYI